MSLNTPVMKFRIATALLLASLVTASLQAQKNLVFEPAQPAPGQTIQIRYNTSATELFGLDNISALAYLLANKGQPVVQEVQLSKQGADYVGNITTNDSTRAVFVRFTSGEKSDNNNGEGYYTLLYGTDGKPMQGAALAAATGFYSNAYPIGMKFNAETFARVARQEFDQYPGSKQKFLADYLSALSQSKEESGKEELKKALDAIVANPASQETDLLQAKGYYTRTLRDKDKAAQVDALLKQRFPTGDWVKYERTEAFYKETDLAKKDSIFQALSTQYPPANQQEETERNYRAQQLVIQYGNKGDFANMWATSNHITDKSMLAGAYNSIAWKLAGEGIHGTPGDIKMGKEISGKSLDLLKDAAADPTKRPSYITQAEWKKQQDNTYYMYADTYATLLYHNKEYQKAYELQKEAVTHFKGQDVSMNETYCALTEKLKGAKAAQPELERFVRDGKASQKMKAQLKKIYLGQKHTEAQWTSYLANLEKSAIDKIRAELATKMVNMPAPAFKLKDLNGSEVSLASLKGKTVVVDFWATWCGPCVASFPGMQKAVNKYKNDPNVVFLFIDTWESGATREKQVKDFITKNKYSFTVLYDETKKDSDDFIVVKDYKVEGIPTKFVIDKNSNIRFKSVGFGGDPDALVSELVMMIEMAGSDYKSGATGEKKGF
jgi:thiol-disulfide isomerase/thioredoxin